MWDATEAKLKENFISLKAYDKYHIIFMEENVDKFNFIKIKNIYSFKDTVERMKRQATDWEEDTANHISDKGLVPRMHKSLSKLNNKKATQFLK